MHGAAGVGGVSVGVLCRAAGMTRQNHYKGRSARERSWVDEALVVDLIRAERCRHRRMGGRKLLFLLQGDLATAGVEIGRDRFFALLARHDLLVERRRCRRGWGCTTTTGRTRRWGTGSRWRCTRGVRRSRPAIRG